MKYFIHLPMKMEPIVSSETSAIRTQTPGNYPKRNNLQVYATLRNGVQRGSRIEKKCIVFLLYNFSMQAMMVMIIIHEYV